ncbi:hypothetical protein HDV06_001690 [Boothiomyces sp. JEL0866]|nr:hypothetical protein HDV06_001690 [Boothiomyces sp. JEL0866]
MTLKRGLIAITLTAAAAIPAYFLYQHHKLSRKIKKTQSVVTEYSPSLFPFKRPAKFPSKEQLAGIKLLVFTDTFTTTAPLSKLDLLVSNPAEFLTQYGRLSYIAFSKTPQAKLMPNFKQTSSFKYLNSHPFQENSNPMCGIFKVGYRSDTDLILEVSFDQDGVYGSIINKISVDSNTATFTVQTVMWKDVLTVGGKQVFPMMNPFLRWTHELTAMWILESAINQLVE